MNRMEGPGPGKGLSRRQLLKWGFGFPIASLVGQLHDETPEERIRWRNMDTLSIGKRPIPSSNEMIPVVGLGTWRTFDVGESVEQRKPLLDVLKTLVLHQASVIDSSPMYGSSEKVIGDLSGQLNINAKLFLATKVWTRGREDGIRQMNESFRRMRVKQMDLMQVHNLLDLQTHLPTLRSWKEEKKIRYLGITHYLPSTYPEMVRIIKKEKPDFVQCCYNIATREAEKELLPLAKESGVAVLINRPFEEGTLFQSVKGKPLPPWATEWDIQSWAQFFLKFILSHPAVTCVIPGTSKAWHLKENLEAGSGRIPDEITRKRMVEYFEKSG